MRLSAEFLPIFQQDANDWNHTFWNMGLRDSYPTTIREK